MDLVPNPTRTIAPIAVQALLAVMAVSTLVLAPPASGALWLVPLSSSAAAAMPALAIQGSTRLMGRGPLPGSLVVIGDRRTLSPRLWRAGIMILAAPPAGCIAAAGSGA